MTRKKYIITVTVAYAIGAFLWVYFSDRIIEGIGGSIGFGLYSTFKGFVFVAVTTVLLYLALRRLAEIRPDARPLTTVRGWTAFGLLVLLMLPVLLVSYAVYRSASDKLLEERLAQLEFMTEAVARSIDAEVQRQLAQTPTETPLATIHRMLDGGNAGFGRLAAFAGLMGESAQVVIADRTGRGPWRIAGRDEALPDGLARLAGRVAAGTAVDILELTDGERMLAAAADIPAAGAVLMATINTRDVVDDVRGVAFLSALTAAAFLLAAVVLAVLIAQRQKLAATLALAEQQEALHAAEARFRATFEQAAVGIAHLDLDGRFLRVNETPGTLLGYDRKRSPDAAMPTCGRTFNLPRKARRATAREKPCPSERSSRHGAIGSIAHRTAGRSGSPASNRSPATPRRTKATSSSLRPMPLPAAPPSVA